MPALLISTSIGTSFSRAARAFTCSAIVTSTFSMRSVLYLAESSASVDGVSARRCVAMTVQPFARYCFVNSRPIPELAPVISTVSAVAEAGINQRASRVAMNANGNRRYVTSCSLRDADDGDAGDVCQTARIGTGRCDRRGHGWHACHPQPVTV